MKLSHLTLSSFCCLVILILCLSLCLDCLAAAHPNLLTPQELAEGWLLLWDGESLFGWESNGVKPEWQINNGILFCESGEDSWIITSMEFADFTLKVEYRNSADGNSGIFLRASEKGNPAQSGYEVQICDMHRHYPTGSLVAIKKARKSLSDPEAWHTLELTAEADHLTVRLDGSRLLDTHDSSFRTGHIGLQFNKGKRIEFQNIKLRPLGMKPIFNGVDLSGWNSVSPPGATFPASWSVKNGAIHAEKGPGRLESAREFGDFFLQLEIRTNPESKDQHPVGGIIFRGEKGRFFSGYECRIRNEFQEKDRGQPVDSGTGGIVHYQAARKIIADDGEFFHETIGARGHHLAVWINGIQITSFTDLNPEGLDVSRNQARVKAGVLGLQTHDSSTNLDLRNLRIAEFPASPTPQP